MYFYLNFSKVCFLTIFFIVATSIISLANQRLQGALADTAGTDGPPFLWNDWPAAVMLSGWAACLALPGALH